MRVHVSGLNPTDLKARTGFSSAMPFSRIIPHQDGAGVIDAVGDPEEASRVGQQVRIYEAQHGRAAGTAADYVVVPSAQAVPLPGTVSFEVGASLGIPALTAHRCLFADGDIRSRNDWCRAERAWSALPPSFWQMGGRVGCGHGQ